MLRKIDVLLKAKPWLLSIAFLGLVIVLRWSAFYRSVLNWDESLYLLVADRWLNGAPPYTEIWDNKPPGIYALFALFMLVFGRSVLAIRIGACLFVAMTCFGLYLMGRAVPRSGKLIGILAGIFFAIASLNNGGLGSNTDVFYTTFVVFGFCLLLSPRSARLPASTALATGVFLGLAFEIKYVVVFDLGAALLLLAIQEWFWLPHRSRLHALRQLIRSVAWLLLGFSIPVAIVTIGFALSGHWDEFVYANFTANRLRTVGIPFAIDVPLNAIRAQIQQNPLFWLCVPAAGLLLVLRRSIPPTERQLVSSWLLWLCFNLLSICVVMRGFLYEHYFLQILAPLCLLAAYCWTQLIVSLTRKHERIRLRLLCLGVLLAVVLFNQAFDPLMLSAKSVYFQQIKGDRFWNDRPAEIAAYLKPRLQPQDYIYVANDEPIIYFLTQAKTPTRFVFPPFLVLRVDLPNITGVEPLAELDRIMQRQPAYVVKRQNEEDPFYVPENRKFFAQLNQALAENYQLEQTIDGVNLYRRRDLQAPAV